MAFKVEIGLAEGDIYIVDMTPTQASGRKCDVTLHEEYATVISPVSVEHAIKVAGEVRQRYLREKFYD